MPPDMRYTIGRQKEISISILNSEKPRRSRLRGFSYLLGAGRSNLRMATSLLSVHPFADVVGYYACRNREYKGNQPIHAEHPLPLPVWGVVACTVYHGCRIAARKAGFCTSQNKNGIYARRLIHAVQTVSLSSAAARRRPAFPRSAAWMGRYAEYFEMKSPEMSGAVYSGCLRTFILCSYNVGKL